ncbi:hypothetical protein JMUB6875_75540 [Nocardia sp. JMUB6875]|uniref:DUF5919 domain-containing protein n=1 Tax=Nocardia sp. JMUB6875 TaxID=3158170 RepID=UPI0032E732E0
MGTVLKALLQQRHLQTLSAFNREYDRLARKIDPELVGCGPKKAQFYRWLAGGLASLPYPHHRRILQAMFPDKSIAELFEQSVGSTDALTRAISRSWDASAPSSRRDTADIEAVYPNRMAFLRDLPPQELFRDARRIDMAGLSLNLLCQQCSDSDILDLLRSGTRIRCLFLDPKGANIGLRELEEGHPTGVLASLTDLNIRALHRVRSRVADGAPGSIAVRVYDSPIRYNITIVDAKVCVMQPYLPTARGIDSPTFVARRSVRPGIFDTFSGVFETMWADAREELVE